MKIEDLMLSETVQLTKDFQNEVNQFLLGMGFFSQRLGKWASEPGSPLSLDALLQYQANRKNRFTPPNSPSKKTKTFQHSPYSPMGPSK